MRMMDRNSKPVLPRFSWWPSWKGERVVSAAECSHILSDVLNVESPLQEVTCSSLHFSSGIPVFALAPLQRSQPAASVFSDYFLQRRLSFARPKTDKSQLVA